ncbi:hypothetical protein JXA84_09580 [candidate division WOR-3 bacterium]|nr:hypothetical protein [candidate division WOR-3 bacterium]
MVDIHCHLLPGVDDGSSNWDETMDLAREMQDLGFKKIVATPHCYNNGFDSSLIKSLTEKASKNFSEKGVKIEVMPGAEIYYDDSVSFEPSFHLGLTLGDSKYILVEFGFLGIPQRFENFRFSAETHGLGVILAHPCRYPYLALKNLEKLVLNGTLVQLNLGALSGKYGFEAENRCKKILQAGLSHFLATDSHGLNRWNRTLAEELETAKKIIGEKEFYYLTGENPQKIFNGAKASSIAPVEVKIKTGKFFGV